MKRRIKSWSLPPRKARRLESGHLLLAGVAGAMALGSRSEFQRQTDSEEPGR